MAAEDFHASAAAFPEPFRLLALESAGSTNDEVRQRAVAGAADGLIVLADRQTAGRGRRGAAWFSPAGEGLAFSILVRPPDPKPLWPRLALAAGLAVAEALERHGVEAGIKWPNDVWVGNRKIAGILVEAGPDFAVVGIGLNINSTGFPDEVAAIATSLRLETSQDHDRGAVLASLVGRFAVRRGQIGGEFGALLRGLRERCVLTGHQVSLLTPRGPLHGVAEGISDAGELLLRTPDGILEALIQADEVRIAGT